MHIHLASLFSATVLSVLTALLLHSPLSPLSCPQTPYFQWHASPMRPPWHLQRKPLSCTADFLLLAYQATHFVCDTPPEEFNLELLKTPFLWYLFSITPQKRCWEDQVFEKLFIFLFTFKRHGLGLEGDNKLYSSGLQCWCNFAKGQIQKMINSNSQAVIYKAQWGAEGVFRYRDNGWVVLPWWILQYSCLYPAVRYTPPPLFCISLCINALSSLWKGWESNSAKLRQKHISTLTLSNSWKNPWKLFPRALAVLCSLS